MKHIQQIVKEEIHKVIQEIIDDADDDTIDMFSHTPKTQEERLSKARELAKRISTIDGIRSAEVDDWNEHGSFQIIAELDLGMKNMPKSPTFNMAQIKRQIYRMGKEIFDILPNIVDIPKRKYERSQFMGEKNLYPKGYERNYIKIDYEF